MNGYGYMVDVLCPATCLSGLLLWIQGLHLLSILSFWPSIVKKKKDSLARWLRELTVKFENVLLTYRIENIKCPF